MLGDREIEQHHDGEGQTLAAVDRDEPHGVVLLGEHRGLRFVGLGQDLLLQEARERGEGAAVTRGDLEQAQQVAEAHLSARQPREQSLEVEELERETDGIARGEPGRDAREVGEAFAEERGGLALLGLVDGVEAPIPKRSEPATRIAERRERRIGEPAGQAARHGRERVAIERVLGHGERGEQIAHLARGVELAPRHDEGDPEPVEGELDERKGGPATRQNSEISIGRALLDARAAEPGGNERGTEWSTRLGDERRHAFRKYAVVDDQRETTSLGPSALGGSEVPLLRRSAPDRGRSGGSRSRAPRSS